jgi:hypothetical protein
VARARLAVGSAAPGSLRPGAGSGGMAGQ